MNESEPSRRDFLLGKPFRSRLGEARDAIADGLLDPETGLPAAGETLRLGSRAMACDFEVILNPGPAARLGAASAALCLVDELEDQLSVYRPHTELSELNRLAFESDVAVEAGLFGLLSRSQQLSAELEGAFDPTTGPLIALWRTCRADGRLPTTEEICLARASIGMEQVKLTPIASQPESPGNVPCTVGGTVRYLREGIEINLGSNGKGYALDRMKEHLNAEKVVDFLVHGGHSSVLACGSQAGLSGWPVSVRDPLHPTRMLATLTLREEALSTSGAGLQGFRHGGTRYGHILDPRTGWPVSELLTVTVVAKTAELADALSTAFFVLGVEKTRRYCHNHKNIGALLVPAPLPGRRLRPIVCGTFAGALHWAPDVVPAELDIPSPKNDVDSKKNVPPDS